MDDFQSHIFVAGAVIFGFWALFEKALPLWGYHIHLAAFVLSTLGFK